MYECSSQRLVTLMTSMYKKDKWEQANIDSGFAAAPPFLGHRVGSHGLPCWFVGVNQRANSALFHSLVLCRPEQFTCSQQVF